jgi:hypothetical protein
MARMRLKNVSVLGVAMWHGLYSLIFAMFLGAAYSGYAYLRVGRLPTYYLVYFMVGLPAVYCPLGFLAYGLVAKVYNSIARSAGGISVEFEQVEDNLPAPPSFLE